MSDGVVKERLDEPDVAIVRVNEEVLPGQTVGVDVVKTVANHILRTHTHV